jgi:hypothetical protein
VLPGLLLVSCSFEVGDAGNGSNTISLHNNPIKSVQRCKHLSGKKEPVKQMGVNFEIILLHLWMMTDEVVNSEGYANL